MEENNDCTAASQSPPIVVIGRETNDFIDNVKYPRSARSTTSTKHVSHKKKEPKPKETESIRTLRGTESAKIEKPSKVSKSKPKGPSANGGESLAAVKGKLMKSDDFKMFYDDMVDQYKSYYGERVDETADMSQKGIANELFTKAAKMQNKTHLLFLDTKRKEFEIEADKEVYTVMVKKSLFIRTISEQIQAKISSIQMQQNAEKKSNVHKKSKVNPMSGFAKSKCQTADLPIKDSCNVSGFQPEVQFLKSAKSDLKEKPSRFPAGLNVESMELLPSLLTMQMKGSAGHHSTLAPSFMKKLEERTNSYEDKMIAKLHAYRQGFGALILHFLPYESIFLDIKRVFEYSIDYIEEKMYDCLPIRKNILMKERNLDARIANFDIERRSDMNLLDKQNAKLQSCAKNWDATIEVLQLVINRLESKLGHLRENSRMAVDQTKLMIEQINRHRAKLGMPKRPEMAYWRQMLQRGLAGTVEIETFTVEPGDSLILIKAVQTALKDFEDHTKQLQDKKAEYATVIPRTAVPELRDELDALKIEYDNIIQAYAEEETEYANLPNPREIKAEHKTAKEECERLRVDLTPRPSWTKYGIYTINGEERWKSVIKGMRSSAIMEKLTDEVLAKQWTDDQARVTLRWDEWDKPIY